MTQVDTRSIGYGLAASLAVHLLLLAAGAVWLGTSAFPVPQAPPEPQAGEPAVTLLYPENIQAEPEPAPEVPTPKKPPAERYIRTTQNNESVQAPENPAFISDRNTTASARMDPTPGGDPAMPTTSGVDVPTLELANRDYRDGEIKNDSAPSIPAAPPSPAPAQPTPPIPPSVPPPTATAKKSTASAEEMMLELDDQLAKAHPKEPLIDVRPAMSLPDDPPPAPAADPSPPMPPPQPPEPPAPQALPLPNPLANAPKPEKDAFQPETRTAKAKGRLSNRGDADAVDAAATSTGRYMRQVTSAIEKKWHRLRIEKQDFVEPGKLSLKFYVNKNGQAEDITIVFNHANPVLTDFSITAILKANIPPIPEDLLLILDKERFPIEYDIVIY